MFVKVRGVNFFMGEKDKTRAEYTILFRIICQTPPGFRMERIEWSVVATIMFKTMFQDVARANALNERNNNIVIIV